MNLPAVSVVIPCYNEGAYLLDAVRSVEHCDPHDYELIIVDDGSTDPGTLELLGRLEREGYRVIHQPNLGLPAARNAGIAASKCRYILPLDADNRITRDYIRRAVKVLDRRPEVGVVYADAGLFGDRKGVWRFSKFDALKMLGANQVEACSVFRKTVWAECGGYDSQMKDGYEDWEFWIHAASKGWKFVHMNHVLFGYRYRADSRSRRWPSDIKGRMIQYMLAKHHVFLHLQLKRAAARQTRLQKLRKRWLRLIHRIRGVKCYWN